MLFYSTFTFTNDFSQNSAFLMFLYFHSIHYIYAKLYTYLCSTPCTTNQQIII